jgi:hypothetical protein
VKRGTPPLFRIAFGHGSPPLTELDKLTPLVQDGAKGCIMVKASQQKRFTVSIDQVDYDALRALAEAQKPPLNLQYLLRLAVKNLLEQHAAKQLSFPLDR